MSYWSLVRRFQNVNWGQKENESYLLVFYWFCSSQQKSVFFFCKICIFQIFFGAIVFFNNPKEKIFSTEFCTLCFCTALKKEYQLIRGNISHRQNKNWQIFHVKGSTFYPTSFFYASLTVKYWIPVVTNSANIFLFG